MTPAAILSILVKTDGVSVASGQIDGLDKNMKHADKTGDTMGKTLKRAGALLGGAFVVDKAISGIKGIVKAASESEVSNSKMRTQLKALGLSYDAHAKDIDKVIQKTSALSGLDDEDLQDSFTNIVRVTGDVNKALKLNGLAADFARAKHIDVAKAGEIVGKVAGGNIGILARYGIQTKKGATSTEALALLQKKFAGQAKAYGETSAGAQEKFGVAVENLQETLGAKLLPIVTKVAGGIANFVNGMSTGEGAGGKFVATIRGIVDAFVKWKDVLIPVGIAIGVIATGFGVYTAALKVAAVAQAAFNAVMAVNPITLVVLALGALVAAVIYAYRESETFRAIVNGAWTAIKAVAGPVISWLADTVPAVWDKIKNAASAVFGWLKSNWPLVLGILTGPIGLFVVAVTKYRSQVVDAFKALPGLIVAALKAAPGLLLDVGKWLLARVIDGVKAVASLVADAAKWLFTHLDDAVRLHLEALKKIGGFVIDTIVAGIKGAVSAITGVASWLKDQVVGAVKKAFGIDSPSKVMAELGGHMASGLIKGVLDGNVMGFIKSHLGGVTSIAGNVLGGIGGKVAGLFGGGKGGGGGGGSLQKWLTTALSITGQLTPGNLAALTKQALSESGGNPKAINLWDSNAAAGHPSKGLLQTIDSTFNAYKMPGMGDIWNPIHNAVAAIRYMLARYGHIVGTGHGYAKGTPGAAKGWAWVGENGRELVNFKGGEQVLSHRDSMRLAGYASGTKDAAKAMALADRARARAGRARDEALAKARAQAAVSKGTGGMLNPPDLSKMSPIDRFRYIEAAKRVQEAMGAVKPPIKGQLPAAAVVDAPAGSTTGDANQALIDAINGLKELEQRRIDLETRLLLEANTKYNVSQSQYAILAQAIADVTNGQIGQRLGLGLSGLRAPAGAVART